MDCLFCKIISGEVPSEKIYEDDKVLAVLDAFPKSPGHTLIIPKTHTRDLMTLKEDFDIAGYVRTVVEKLRSEYDFEDFKVVINNGPSAGQEIFHLHVHIIPYYSSEDSKDFAK